MEKDEKIELLKELRKEEGLNRKEFALEYDIPYPTITDWEMGHRRIPEYFLRLLDYKVRSGKAKKIDYSEELAKQLAYDYCCTPEEVLDDRNHFTFFSGNDGQRIFDSMDHPALRAAVVNGKILFTGESSIISACEEKYNNTLGSWFMDAGNFRLIEELLAENGYRIKTVHSFCIPTDNQDYESDDKDFELVKYHQDEIEQFRGDRRFDEAFCFDEKAPDMLGIAAVKDGNILGMAGASADSPTFWQIGINVMPEAEGKHVATTLVSEIKKEIIALGKVPYYGTGMSNIASQRVALNSGFKPAWVELLSEKIGTVI